MKGKVKKLMRDKGFGFILGEDHVEYFFHQSQLKNIRFDVLIEGQEVEFEEVEADKGPRAEDVYA